jgi:hypothetical protein
LVAGLESLDVRAARQELARGHSWDALVARELCWMESGLT